MRGRNWEMLGILPSDRHRGFDLPPLGNTHFYVTNRGLEVPYREFSTGAHPGFLGSPSADVCDRVLRERPAGLDAIEAELKASITELAGKVRKLLENNDMEAVLDLVAKHQ